MFEGVYGIETTREMGEVIAHSILPKWRPFEVSLMQTKWFDYRQLTPVQATYLFAHYYRDAFKRFFRMHVNHASAEYVKPLKDEDLFKNKQVTVSGLWRARQHADAMGVPYEEYLADAFERAMKTQRERLPLTTQLYTDNVLEFVQERWEQRQRAKLYVAESDLYRNDNYLGLTAQDAHHEWLFAQAEKRPNRIEILNDLIYRREKLPEEKMIARYEPDQVKQIQEYA